MRGEKRAVSNIIGTMIIFGFVVTLIVLLQVAAVPVWNENVEYEHSQRVQGDMSELRDRISLSSATGRATTASVEVGTRYPTRALFVNPTNPSGTVSTLEGGTVTVDNSVASGDTEAYDYWNGSTREFRTRPIMYTPDYSEYENAPTTYIDNGVLFNGFEDGEQSSLSDQSLVSGTNINLNLVGGRLSRSSVGAASIDVNPVSAPSQPLTIGGEERIDGGQNPVNVTVPTLLSERRWDELLADERVENGGRIAATEYAEGDPYNRLTVVLEPGEYTLRTSKVAVGPTDEVQEPGYIVARGETGRNVEAGTNETLTVEVRDRYNNPVGGATVESAVTDGPGEVYPEAGVTNDEGIVSFTYVPPSTVTTSDQAEVSLSIGDGAEGMVNFSVRVFEETADGGTGGGGETGGIDQGGDSDVFVSSVDRLRGGSSNEANVVFRNEDVEDKAIERAKFVFFYDAGNCPCADRLRLGAGPVLEAGGETRDLNDPVEIPAGGAETVSFDFGTNGRGGGFSVRRGDFVVVRFGFTDGSRSTYFIQFQTN
jgi:hypothetical protein